MCAMQCGRHLDQLAPFHITLDRDFRVRGAGPALRATLGRDISGSHVFDVLAIVDPDLIAPAALAGLAGAELSCRLVGTPLGLRAGLVDLGEEGLVIAPTGPPERMEDVEDTGIRRAIPAPAPSHGSALLGQLLEQERLQLRELVVQLEDRESRLHGIIDTAIDAILTLDDACRIEHVNPAGVQLFGYAPEELAGQPLWVLLPSPDDERDAEFLEILTMSGIRGEFNAAGKGGRPIAVELHANKLVGRDRTRFTVVLRDISERKKLEQLQSEFVSTVSHELRTPLTAIRGALGLLAGGVTGSLPPEAEECVHIALSNSERLMRLINDILDLDKVQSGKLDFRMEVLELRSVIMAALEASATLAAAQDIELRLVGEPAPGHVLGDEQRLFQVITNLLSNAAKFSRPGGAVDVSVEQVGEGMRVSVRDRGAGIPEEFRDRIFQRFAQADASSTRKQGGTGLGLSIAKAIVESMHGKIDFAAAEGGGTVFYFDLPRVKRTPS